VRAEVTDVVEGPTSLLVGLVVSVSPSAEQQGDRIQDWQAGDGRTDRWQVLTVRDSRITDICGFGDRTEAAKWAGMAP
jgi:hypothetical protein